ncbi:MAG: ABC transporter ATP-binding protein [Chloroflexi bacterium]|nr:ABC transporter ATP-binding protein [Chloroflexota bacterium]
MSDVAIRVDRLSKRYRIGRAERYKTLRDTVVEGVMAPLRALGAALNGHGRTPDDGESDQHIWALRGVSFEVRRGEVVGIIGRNGAGKSTLLKILSRITEPTEGYAEILGRVGSLLEVGTGFHPELSGRENIFLNGAILGMKRAEIERTFDEIVAFAEVEKFVDTPVKHYSTGMQMRLAFAVAAHVDPEILLIDEVLAVGDAGFQKKCLGKMGDIARRGRTVLVVSHNMPSIVNLCQRAILLEAGEVLRDGAPPEVIQQYLGTIRSAGGEAMWADPSRAPGNDIARLHAVRILQEGCEGPIADVDIAKDVLVQIAYWNLREGAELYASIWLRDQMGTPVLASGNATSVSLTHDPWYGRPHPRGLFHSVCRIPGNFLNEGLYSIAAILGTAPSTTQVLQDYVLSFHVHDTGEMRKEFFGGWLGTVRPRLAWHTEFVEPAAHAAERGQ